MRDIAQIGIVAGEASGDLLGSLLIQAIQDAGYKANFTGIAGPKMQVRKAQSLFPMETLSVRGYVEALSSLRRILGIRKQLKNRFLQNRPRLFIGIDAPDFNLGLEKTLKNEGIPTVHFISPSIWAWRGGRIRKIRKSVDHMLLIFPFEAEIYEKAGIPATYVGHPLAYALPEQPDRKATRQRIGLRQDETYLALLPGSRISEVKSLATLYIEAAKRIHETRPDVQFLVPLVNRDTRQAFEEAVHQTHAHELPIRILYGHAHDAMQAADAAIIASGTATLEALLLDCPHIITYRVPWLTYQIMKRQAYLPWVGLPNILAREFIVPELLQEHANPKELADTALDLLDDASKRAEMSARFAQIRGSLRRDTPRLIAQTLAPFLSP